MKMIIIFAIATAINVLLQTTRSLLTIKGGKLVAATINAVCYGVYTYVIVLTASDIPLWIKITITAVANFIGVYIVKLIEEKMRKDKLWEVRATVSDKYASSLEKLAEARGLSFSVIPIKDHHIFNFYCETQKQSLSVKQLLQNYPNTKYFVSESKIL